MHQIATRSVTGRLARRTWKDINPPSYSPPKRLCREYTGKEDDCKASDGVDSVSDQYSMVRTRRQWALWTVEEKNQFFEALFEHGKDFDAIQGVLASKHKRRNVELDSTLSSSGSGSGVKTKDQIRHCYYRTWHAISHYINTTKIDDTNKQALELFGLICYGELRKKGIMKINERNGQRLNELVHKGSTILKIRGKNYRIKVPNCRALKKLCSTEDTLEENKQKVPDRITVELRARSNAAWRKVQAMAHNPRIRLHMKPDKSLASVLDFLCLKWKSSTQHMQQQSLDRDFKDTSNLHLYVPADQVLKLPQVAPIRTTLKDNLSFYNYLASCSASGSGEEKLRVSNRSTQSISIYQEENAQLNDLRAEYDIGSEKRYNTLSSLSQNQFCSTSHTGVLVSSMPYSAHITALNVETNIEKTINDNKNISSLNHMWTSCAQMPTPCCRVLSTSTSRIVDVPPLSLNQVSTTSVVCEDMSSVCLSDGSAALQRTAPGNPANENRLSSRQTAAAACSSALDRLLGLEGTPIDRRLGRDVNIIDLYLMMSKPHIMILEYDWLDSATSVSVVEMMLNKPLSNRLRRLVDTVTMEFIGGHRSGIAAKDKYDALKKNTEDTVATTESSSPLHSSVARSSRPMSNHLVSYSTVADSQIGEVTFKVPQSMSRKARVNSRTQDSAGPALRSYTGEHATGSTTGEMNLVKTTSSFNTYPALMSRRTRFKRGAFTNINHQQSHSSKCSSLSSSHDLKKSVSSEKEAGIHTEDVVNESQPWLCSETSNILAHSIAVVHQPPPSMESIEDCNAAASSCSMIMMNPCQTWAPAHGHVMQPHLLGLIEDVKPSLQSTNENVMSLSVNAGEHISTRQLIHNLDRDEQWFDGESFNLSNFLPDSPLKLTSTDSYPPSNTALVSLAPVPSPRSHTSLSLDGTRDSAILQRLDVDSTLQCMMNENSLDYVAKFADLVARVTPTGPPSDSTVSICAASGAAEVSQSSQL